MAAGAFDFQLNDDTPPEIIDKLNMATGGFGQVIFTSTRLSAEALSAASLRKASYYVGILRTQSGRTYGGASPLILLGDEDGKGPILSTGSALGSGTLYQWWALSLGASNGVGIGTNVGSGSTMTGPLPPYITKRQALELVASATGDEFRQSIASNGDIVVDAGTVANLYGSTPAGMVIKRDGGFEPGIIGLRATDLGDAMDVEDYTSKVYWISRADGGATVATATAGSVPYYAPGGGATIQMERVVDSSAAVGVDASAMATVELGKYQSLRRQFNVRVDADDLFGFTHSVSGSTTTAIRDGDYLYVYDPDNGIKDTANQVVYRGDVLHPLKLRVYGIAIPVLRGGVYFVSPNAAQTVTDLSDWVEWETGDATLTVGAQARSLLGGSSSGSSPYGGLPTTLVSDARTSWTPSMKGSGSNPTLTAPTGEWRRMGTDVWGSFEITINNPGTGTYKITGPASLRGTRQRTVGHGFCYDVTAPGTYWPFTLRSVGDGTADMYMFSAGAIGGTGTNFSQTSPFTFATGDYIEGQFFAEAATS